MSSRPYLYKSVRIKATGDYGYTNYSTFGYSVHFMTEDGCLAKTTGMPESVLLEYYEVLDEIPEGYKLNEKYMALEEVIK